MDTTHFIGFFLKILRILLNLKFPSNSHLPGRWCKAARIWQRIHVNHTYIGPVRETPGCAACVECTVARNRPLRTRTGDGKTQVLTGSHPSLELHASHAGSRTNFRTHAQSSDVISKTAWSPDFTSFLIQVISSEKIFNNEGLLTRIRTFVEKNFMVSFPKRTK